MSSLDTIVGTRGRELRTAPAIVCNDGFTMSVQASSGHYCTDANGSRDFYWDDRKAAALPYLTVEVGFPSARPEPWAEWEEYADEPQNPTETVYGFVPVQVVRDLIALHGGERP